MVNREQKIKKPSYFLSKESLKQLELNHGIKSGSELLDKLIDQELNTNRKKFQ